MRATTAEGEDASFTSSHSPRGAAAFLRAAAAGQRRSTERPSGGDPEELRTCRRPGESRELSVFTRANGCLSLMVSIAALR